MGTLGSGFARHSIFLARLVVSRKSGGQRSGCGSFFAKERCYYMHGSSECIKSTNFKAKIRYVQLFINYL